MRRFSAAQVLAALFSVLILSLMPACSGSTAAKSTVSQLILSPLSMSLNPGQVAQITARPEDSTGAVVVADVTYASGNTSVVTISPAGFVCAGVWDANFIVCNANPGQSAVGQATITATTANAVTATLPVYTHLQADRIVVDPILGCVSIGALPTYTASVYNVTSPGCTTANPCNITATVGPIVFNSTDLQVMSNNVTTGALTATNPGQTTIFATVAGLNSTPQPALVCPIQSIHVHDANGTGTSFTLASAATQALAADVVDTNGVTVTPILNWASSQSGSSTVAGTTGANTATVTAVNPGTTVITATCSTPGCNRNVPPQYGQNVVTVTTSGATTTTAFAGSTSSLTVVPIASSGNTAGTAITLPFLPNSMVTDHAGTNLYLGSASGVMTVNAAAGTVTSTSAVNGTILAISNNDQYLLIANGPAGVGYLYSIPGASITLSQSVVPTAGAFTADSTSLSFTAGQQVYYETTLPTASIANLSYVPSGIDVSAQGGMTYVTSATSQSIDVRSTCNQSSWQTLAANNPTLVAHLPNGTGALVADSPNVDLITTGTLQNGCPPSPQNTMNSYPLNGGAFNPRQLLISSDGTRAWIISDLTSVLGFNISNLTASSIALAGGAQAFSGGLTLDGSHLYVGATDNNVHVLDTAAGTDSAQIAVGLKDANSNPVAPNLVVVLPK